MHRLFLDDLKTGHSGSVLNVTTMGKSTFNIPVDMAMDSAGNMLFATTDGYIACWHTDKLFTDSNIRVIEHNLIGYPRIMKVFTNAKGEEELWVVAEVFNICTH